MVIAEYLTSTLTEKSKMLKPEIVGQLVNDISYELDLDYFGKTHGNVINISKLKDWRDTIKLSYKAAFEKDADKYSEVIEMLDKLDSIIAAEEEEPIVGLATSELREFYGELMAGKIHPKVKDYQRKRERYVLEDDDICESIGINHLEVVDSARSRRFIDLMIEKYKPIDMTELRSLFSSEDL